MQRKMIAVALGALTVFSSAFAEETKPVGLSVRLGAFFPSDRAARNAEDDVWFGGGVEYKLSDLKFGAATPGYSAMLTLSADYINKGSFRNAPVMLNYVGMSNQFYYSAGAGVSFIRFPGNSGNRSETEFAYGAGVGYNFNQGMTPFFVEARWFGTSETRVNGWGLFVGVRL